MTQGDAARQDRTFHLFVYGTLRAGREAAGLLAGCEKIAVTTVPGTLYDLDTFPALVLAGHGRVEGEVWRCSVDRLADFDRHEGVAEGLFRRVGVQVGEWACWAYVAGPRLAPRIAASRRIESGAW